MAIDYRSEVDSGFDRKRIVESNIIALLREGIPTDIITKSPEFNYKHLEMINNLERGYDNKEEQILEIYGGYSKELSEQIVPDRYSGVSHPVGGELYPMTEQEEQEKFKERDSYITEIEKLQKKEIKNIEKEKNKIITAITKYKTKFPIIDRIIDAISEIDELQEKNKDNPLNVVDYTVIFKKNGLNPKELSKYDKIYNDYNELTNYLSKITIKYEEAINGKIHNEEIEKLTNQKNLLEVEIVQRNTKLVNGFIREKYGDLLVETDDLFQTCYIAMWEAVKTFDYKKGRKFSTYAYEYMGNEIKRRFKELTGYSWSNYWTKKKIIALLKNTSKTLGRKITIDELVQYGFLDMSEKRANGFLDIAEERSLSDLYPIEEKSYDEYEMDSEYALYFGDDEIDDYETGKVDQIVINSDSNVMIKLLREEIENVLSTLTDREKMVLKLRFGLEDGIQRTLEETGAMFNVGRERIRQIEAKALRKLRHPMRSKKLKDYLNNMEESYSEEYHTPLK